MVSLSSATLQESFVFFFIRSIKISGIAFLDKCNTITIAAFKSSGNCDISSLIALMPPAEAPIPITKKDDDIDLELSSFSLAVFLISSAFLTALFPLAINTISKKSDNQYQAGKSVNSFANSILLVY